MASPKFGALADLNLKRLSIIGIIKQLNYTIAGVSKIPGPQEQA